MDDFRSATSLRLSGIAELFCWMAHFKRDRTGREVEESLDAHLACGIKEVVWKIGRSVVEYHTHHPAMVTEWGRNRGADPSKAEPVHRDFTTMCRERCLLSSAVTYGHAHGMKIYGRLCMNRHYGDFAGRVFTSNLASDFPEWHERTKTGVEDGSRLCFAWDRYVDERALICAEAAQTGIDGLQLDFCRQPPMVLYHESVVAAYRRSSGKDPLSISVASRDEFLAWCRFRAGYVTECLRRIRHAVNKAAPGIPLQVRITDSGFDINLVEGCDIETWVREGLIDELALSSLQYVDGTWFHDPAPYVALCRGRGIPVLAGINLIPPVDWLNETLYNPLLLAQRSLYALSRRVDGLSLYQSETGAVIKAVNWIVRHLTDEKYLRDVLEDKDMIERYPVTYLNSMYGMDNHSRFGRYSLTDL